MAIDYSKYIYANKPTPYADMYKTQEQEARARNTEAIAQINRNRDNDLAKSSAGYDATARQNYINYMQAQKRLPSELNALGIRGGASESSLIRLGTNYNTNVANNESARQTAADDIRNAYAKQLYEANANLTDKLREIRLAAEQNQLNWEKEQMDKDLERFSGVIEGLYTKKKNYKKLIEKLKKSNDPNKEYKIMLAKRAMNQLQSSGGSGGSGGSGRRSYGGSGGSYGGGYDNDSGNSGVDVSANINAAQQKGAAMTEYYKKAANKSSKSIKGDTYTVTSKGSYRAKR